MSSNKGAKPEAETINKPENQYDKHLPNNQAEENVDVRGITKAALEETTEERDRKRTVTFNPEEDVRFFEPVSESSIQGLSQEGSWEKLEREGMALGRDTGKVVQLANKRKQSNPDNDDTDCDSDWSLDDFPTTAPKPRPKAMNNTKPAPTATAPKKNMTPETNALYDMGKTKELQPLRPLAKVQPPGGKGSLGKKSPLPGVSSPAGKTSGAERILEDYLSGGSLSLGSTSPRRVSENVGGGSLLGTKKFQPAFDPEIIKRSEALLKAQEAGHVTPKALSATPTDGVARIGSVGSGNTELLFGKPLGNMDLFESSKEDQQNRSDDLGEEEMTYSEPSPRENQLINDKPSGPGLLSSSSAFPAPLLPMKKFQPAFDPAIIRMNEKRLLNQEDGLSQHDPSEADQTSSTRPLSAGPLGGPLLPKKTLEPGHIPAIGSSSAPLPGSPKQLSFGLLDLPTSTRRTLAPLQPASADTLTGVKPKRRQSLLSPISTVQDEEEKEKDGVWGHMVPPPGFEDDTVETGKKKKKKGKKGGKKKKKAGATVAALPQVQGHGGQPVYPHRQPPDPYGGEPFHDETSIPTHQQMYDEQTAQKMMFSQMLQQSDSEGFARMGTTNSHSLGPYAEDRHNAFSHLATHPSDLLDSSPIESQYPSQHPASPYSSIEAAPPSSYRYHTGPPTSDHLPAALGHSSSSSGPGHLPSALGTGTRHLPPAFGGQTSPKGTGLLPSTVGPIHNSPQKRSSLPPARGGPAPDHLAPIHGPPAPGPLGPIRGSLSSGPLGPIRGSLSSGPLGPIRGSSASDPLGPIRGSQTAPLGQIRGNPGSTLKPNSAPGGLLGRQKMK